MKRGVVVECNDDFVTLLTPDGQFLKANNKKGNYELGEEISFFPSMDEREEAATRTTRTKKRSFSDYFNFRSARVGALSVLVIIFFMISFLPFFNNDKVYAYMSIDINPSFEVGIDDQLKVISLETLNEEAEKLIDMLPEWENKPFYEIVDAIVNESKSEGFVYPGKEIVITTVIKEEDKDAQIELEKDINEIRTSYEKEDMVVKTIETDSETRENAQRQGISTGKYLQLQEKAADESKEDVIKPAEKQGQSESEGSSTPDEAKNNSLLDAADVNRQSVKDELTSDTKEKLHEVKNKLKEDSKKTNNDEKKQEANKQKHQNKYVKEAQDKKNERKNIIGKDIRNNKDDKDIRNDRDDRDDKNDD
ncbi:MAG: anti-sigma-I factor RsgI family protein [Bacillota bacterium]